MYCRLDGIDGAALQSADRLKVIARYGVGVDNVDLEAAGARRASSSTNTPGARSSVSVADCSIALDPITGAWCRTQYSNQSGTSTTYSRPFLDGKVVGLIGFGSIGKQVIHAASPALSPPVSLWPKRYLHLPLLPETTGVINADFLRKMKKRVVSW